MISHWETLQAYGKAVAVAHKAALAWGQHLGLSRDAINEEFLAHVIEGKPSELFKDVLTRHSADVVEARAALQPGMEKDQLTLHHEMSGGACLAQLLKDGKFKEGYSRESYDAATPTFGIPGLSASEAPAAPLNGDVPKSWTERSVRAPGSNVTCSLPE